MSERKIFSVIFEFKVPSSEGRALDFRNKKEEIFDSVKNFNERFNFKGIKLIDIREQSIEFLFYIEIEDKEVSVSARDLSVLSKFLYHERGWENYSRETAKLFTATKFEDITSKIGDKYDILPEISRKILWDINIVDDDIDNKVTDQQTLKLLESLINVKGIGSDDLQEFRKESLRKIKTILFNNFSSK